MGAKDGQKSGLDLRRSDNSINLDEMKDKGFIPLAELSHTAKTCGIWCVHNTHSMDGDRDCFRHAGIHT